MNDKTQQRMSNVEPIEKLPEELKRGANEAFSSAIKSAEAADNSAKSGTEIVRAESLELGAFSRHIHKYVREYIKLADRKSAFIFTFSSALLAYLYQKDAHTKWTKTISTWTASDLIIFVAMISLLIGIAAAILVILPRLSKSHHGYIFFKSIAEFESASEYAIKVATEDQSSLNSAILRHTFDLANICTKKYKGLFISIWASAIGVILSFIWLLFCT